MKFSEEVQMAVASGTSSLKELYGKFPEKSRPCVRGTVYRLIARGILRKESSGIEVAGNGHETPEENDDQDSQSSPVFCDECGGLMSPADRLTLRCLACSKEVQVTERHMSSSSVRSQRCHPTGRERVIIIEDEEPLTATAQISCPKCGHGRAKWWMLQTRKADEPETIFHRCVACGYTWRE